MFTAYIGIAEIGPCEGCKKGDYIDDPEIGTHFVRRTFKDAQRAGLLYLKSQREEIDYLSRRLQEYVETPT